MSNYNHNSNGMFQAMADGMRRYSPQLLANAHLVDMPAGSGRRVSTPPSQQPCSKALGAPAQSRWQNRILSLINAIR